MIQYLFVGACAFVAIAWFSFLFYVLIRIFIDKDNDDN